MTSPATTEQTAGVLKATATGCPEASTAASTANEPPRRAGEGGSVRNARRGSSTRSRRGSPGRLGRRNRNPPRRSAVQRSLHPVLEAAAASQWTRAGAIRARRDVAHQSGTQRRVPIKGLCRVGHAASPSGEREGRGDQRRTDAGASEAAPPRLVAFAVLRAVVYGDSEAGISNRRHVGRRAHLATADRFPVGKFELPRGRVEQGAAAAAAGFVVGCELVPDLLAPPFTARPEFEVGAADRDYIGRRGRVMGRPRPASGEAQLRYRCRRLPPSARFRGDPRRPLPGPPEQAPLRPRRSKSHRRRGGQRCLWLLRRPPATRSSPLSGAARNRGRSRVPPRRRATLQWRIAFHSRRVALSLAVENHRTRRFTRTAGQPEFAVVVGKVLLDRRIAPSGDNRNRLGGDRCLRERVRGVEIRRSQPIATFAGPRNVTFRRLCGARDDCGGPRRFHAAGGGRARRRRQLERVATHVRVLRGWAHVAHTVVARSEGRSRRLGFHRCQRELARVSARTIAASSHWHLADTAPATDSSPGTLTAFTI